MAMGGSSGRKQSTYQMPKSKKKGKRKGKK